MYRLSRGTAASAWYKGVTTQAIKGAPPTWRCESCRERNVRLTRHVFGDVDFKIGEHRRCSVPEVVARERMLPARDHRREAGGSRAQSKERSRRSAHGIDSGSMRARVVCQLLTYTLRADRSSAVQLNRKWIKFGSGANATSEQRVPFEAQSSKRGTTRQVALIPAEHSPLAGGTVLPERSDERPSRVERTGVSTSSTENKGLVLKRSGKRSVRKEESLAHRPSIIRSGQRVKVLHRFRSRSGDSVRPSGQRFNL